MSDLKQSLSSLTINNNVSLADVAWNTHRCYGEAGQRIAAAVLEDGRIAVADVHRQVEGCVRLRLRLRLRLIPIRTDLA